MKKKLKNPFKKKTKDTSHTSSRASGGSAPASDPAHKVGKAQGLKKKWKKLDLWGRFRRLGKFKKALIIILVLGLVVWLIWGRGGQEEEFLDEEMFFEQPQVPVERGQVKRTIYVTGHAQAKQSQEVDGVVGQEVLELYVQSGDEVREGDLLYELDDKNARLEYDLKRLEYEQMLADPDSRTGSRLIRAQASGKLGEIKVEEGDEVTVDTVIATVENQDLLELENALSVSDATSLSLGETVQVFLPKYLIFTPGTITHIDQVDTKEENKAPVRYVTIAIEDAQGLVSGVTGEIQKAQDGRTIKVREPGELAYVEGKEVLAKSKGTIASIEAFEGQGVTKDTVVARLDARSAQIGGIEGQLALQQAKMAMETAKEALGERIVRADFDGTVVKLELTKGQEIKTSEPVCVVADMDRLEMKVVIDEYDIGQVYVGQTAEVYFNAFGSEVFYGEIGEVSQQGVLQNGRVNFTAKIYMDGTGKLKPGMSGDADIFVELKEDSLRLPSEAVTILDDGLGMVQVMDEEDMMQPVEIEIGIEGDRYVEVLSGLEEGDMVVSQSGGGMGGYGGGMTMPMY